MSLSLAFGVSYFYSKKTKIDVNKLLEGGEYEELVEIHHESRDFGDLFPSSYKDLNPKEVLSTTKGIAYNLALDDQTLDNIYREFSKELDVEEAYRHL